MIRSMEADQLVFDAPSREPPVHHLRLIDPDVVVFGAATRVCSLAAGRVVRAISTDATPIP